MKSRINVLALSVFFFTGACGDDDGATQGPDITDGATTAATTDEQPTTGAQPTTGEHSTTDDTAADPSTSSDDSTTGEGATSDADTTDEPATDTGATTDVDTTTGAEPDPAVQAACEAHCGRWGECGFQPDLEGCIIGCVDNLYGAADACADASVAALDCKTGLDCLDLLESIEDGGKCSAEADAATAACDMPGCAESFLAEDDSCEFSRECEGEPLKQMNCDGASCTCLEGGQQVGQCADDGACHEPEALADKAAACCRFN